MQIVSLGGTRLAPLANYLKGIAVLRLVSEQVDSNARGWWSNDRLILASSLSDDALLTFFLRDYQPTPLIAPWNGGSGFFKADQKGAWYKGFEPMMSSTAPRFKTYREAITAGQELLGTRDKKFDSKESELKQELLRAADAKFRGKLSDWLRAAFSINADGSPVYPAMLGTGGNDGRLDFTNNFMQKLAELFDLKSANGAAKEGTDAFVRESLFGAATPHLKDTPIGQFAPGAAGGVNSGNGFDSKASVNPVDFLLMLEGAIAFVPALVRRAATSTLPQAAAPFAVHSGSGGHATAVADENNRGEQWMPIWERPLGYQELQQMLGEARCRVGNRSASRPREVVQAIARCGVSNGIRGFQRFGYLERNGQANLAVSLGRWEVAGKVPFADLLAQIEPWFKRLELKSAGGNAPGSWQHHVHTINDSIADCCRVGAGGHQPSRWQRLLVALGDADAALIRSPRATADANLRPLFFSRQGLSSRWIEAAASPSCAELRLAVALAGQGGHALKSSPFSGPDCNDPIRRHFIPLEATAAGIKRPHVYAVSGDRLANATEVVIRDNDTVTDLIALVQRRILSLSANQGGCSGYLPIVPVNGLEATIPDISDWIDGKLNDRIILSMARALMAIDWNDAWKHRQHLSSVMGICTANQQIVSNRLAPWATVRLCFHFSELNLSLYNPSDPSQPITTSANVKVDKSVFSALTAGHASRAIELAARRLKTSGLPVRVKQGLADAKTVRRWAASIAFGVSPNSINQLASKVIHQPGIKTKDPSLEISHSTESNQ